MGSLENLSNKTKNLKIKDDPFINILLLGETGVGKSTFINSIANYLTYNDFKNAEKDKLIQLIPSKCKVQDKHGKYHIINIGWEDHNECLDTGMSATQDVKSYVFPIWNGNLKVRLIDTPGIGDVRGIEQDNVNCESILNYIGQLHELHAICYLFKPTNPRITVYFDYCMTQILSRLDKSASRNIIFIFTNTRGTDYSPGDTFASLQKVINDIKGRPPHVDIPLNKNLFCFDNEAFRYLAAVKQNIEFENSIKQRNLESWKKSAEQCNRLIKYITGDSNNPPLKPHFIKSTSAINEARRLISQLAQPLAEISQLIGDNLLILQRHQEDLDINKNALDQLRQKLYMPVIDLDVTKLDHPVTVCAAKKCAEIYKVGDTNKWHYKQQCHEHCYLTNVPKEIIGSPELINCTAIDSTTGICMRCLCNFSTHMHIYYLTKTVEKKIVDVNIKQNIDSKEKILENVEKLIENIFVRKNELEKEHSIIVKTCAKFAHFLQNNAITPFSDSYKEYVEYLIVRERSLGVLSKMSVIHHLQKLLQEYEAAKQSFDEALQLQKRLGESDVFITPQKIQESIQELYKLKHNGKKIKELYECQKKSRTTEYKNSEYVHEIQSLFKEDQKKKEKKESQNKKEKKDDQKDTKKTATYQKKEFRKPNDRNPTGNQQRERNQSQHRTRNNSPPPAYHDVPSPSQSGPSYGPGPNNRTYDHHNPQYDSRGGPRSDYRSPNYPGRNYYPEYPPHSPTVLPPPPSYGPDNTTLANRDRNASYEFKIMVNEPPPNQRNPPPAPAHPPPPAPAYPPRDPYQHNYPPYPPRDPYQHNYPPYPPYNEGPHYGARPHNIPYPPPHHQGQQYYDGRRRDNYQRQDSNSSGQNQTRENQRPSQNQCNTRNDNKGRGGYKGGKGQDAHKFKKVHRKKKSSSDSDSDSKKKNKKVNRKKKSSSDSDSDSKKKNKKGKKKSSSDSSDSSSD